MTTQVEKAYLYHIIYYLSMPKPREKGTVPGNTTSSYFDKSAMIKTLILRILCMILLKRKWSCWVN